jgi:hypothetical protein
LKHGARSQQVQRAALPEQAEAQDALAERCHAIESDLGGAECPSVLSRDTVGRYLELSLVRCDYLGQKIVAEGSLAIQEGAAAMDCRAIPEQDCEARRIALSPDEVAAVAKQG